MPGARNGCHVVFTVVSTPLSELPSPPGQQAHPRPALLPLANFLWNIHATVRFTYASCVIPAPAGITSVWFQHGPGHKESR